MVVWRGWVVAGVVLYGLGVAQAQRLPGGVRPEHYSLTISPDLAKARFVGSERIDVVLDRPTDSITLNAAEIEFQEVRALVGDLTPTVATVTLDPAKEQATLTFAHPLNAGRSRSRLRIPGY